jgi:hypothetical protein
MPPEIDCLEPVEKGYLFKIRYDEELSVEVRLHEIARQRTVPSTFGRQELPVDSQAYDVLTEDPSCSAQLLVLNGDRRIIVRTSAGQIKEYAGPLCQTVLQAYMDGAFWSMEELRRIRAKFESFAEDWDDPRMDVYDVA